MVKLSSNKIDQDTLNKISLCVKILTNQNDFTDNIFLKETYNAFSNMIKENDEKEKKNIQIKKKELAKINQVDTFLNITQLKGKKFDIFEFEDEDIIKATKNIEKNFSSKLSKVTQLTGFSDPVYAEAIVTVHQFDILLQILVVNQTNDTLQNLTIEFSTIGDLKLCERPQLFTVGPYGSQQIKANIKVIIFLIKVSSTETGIIFGNIVYDVGSTLSNCILLNDIKVDIIDYILPSDIDDSQFRNMWFEFEWENKVPISSTMDLLEYLEFIKNITNMKCITPNSALLGDCDFLSANLYAKSSFSEDSLANVSAEKKKDGKLEGYVKIRSKNQGIAYSLGTKIQKEQKKIEQEKLKL
jgi:coatomer subunit beta